LAEGLSHLSCAYAEQSGEIIVGTGSEEKLVGRAVCRGSATELYSPELIEVDHFIVYPPNGPFWLPLQVSASRSTCFCAGRIK
jgi:hypothetical protein